MYIPNMALGLTGEVIVSAKELVFALTEVMVMLETFKTCFSWCAQNRCVEQMCRRFGNIFQQQILNHKFVLNVQRFLSSIYVKSDTIKKHVKTVYMGRTEDDQNKDLDA